MSKFINLIIQTRSGAPVATVRLSSEVSKHDRQLTAFLALLHRTAPETTLCSEPLSTMLAMKTLCKANTF